MLEVLVSSYCSSTPSTYLNSALATRQTPSLRPPLDLLLVPPSRHHSSIWRYGVAHRLAWVRSRWEWLPLAVILSHRWWHAGWYLRLRALLALALALLLLLWLGPPIDGMDGWQAESRRQCHISPRRRVPLAFRWGIAVLACHGRRWELGWRII